MAVPIVFVLINKAVFTHRSRLEDVARPPGRTGTGSVRARLVTHLGEASGRWLQLNNIESLCRADGGPCPTRVVHAFVGFAESGFWDELGPCFSCRLHTPVWPSRHQVFVHQASLGLKRETFGAFHRIASYSRVLTACTTRVDHGGSIPLASTRAAAGLVQVPCLYRFDDAVRRTCVSALERTEAGATTGLLSVFCLGEDGAVRGCQRRAFVVRNNQSTWVVVDTGNLLDLSLSTHGCTTGDDSSWERVQLVLVDVEWHLSVELLETTCSSNLRTHAETRADANLLCGENVVVGARGDAPGLGKFGISGSISDRARGTHSPLRSHTEHCVGLFLVPIRAGNGRPFQNIPGKQLHLPRLIVGVRVHRLSGSEIRHHLGWPHVGGDDSRFLGNLGLLPPFFRLLPIFSHHVGWLRVVILTNSVARTQYVRVSVPILARFSTFLTIVQPVPDDTCDGQQLHIII